MERRVLGEERGEPVRRGGRERVVPGPRGVAGLEERAVAVAVRGGDAGEDARERALEREQRAPEVLQDADDGERVEELLRRSAVRLAAGRRGAAEVARLGVAHVREEGKVGQGRVRRDGVGERGRRVRRAREADGRRFAAEEVEVGRDPASL